MKRRGLLVNKKHDLVKDILLKEKRERRMLANVPDDTKHRILRDRRGNQYIERDCEDIETFIANKKKGTRYEVDYEVRVTLKDKNRRKESFICRGIDISSTGILLSISDEQLQHKLDINQDVHLQFDIIPGTMPEGYEMKVRMNAKVSRINRSKTTGKLLVGVQFEKELSVYASRRKDRCAIWLSSFFLLFISAFILLMRAESVIFFKFNKWLYLYSIIAAGFLLTRYLFALFYKPVPIDVDFTPGVSIVIPCFNEEEWIQKTILSCLNQDYPIDKLEVIVVDDCSTDKSVKVIKETMDELYRGAERYEVRNRLKCIVQHKNAGKREALVLGTEAAKHDLVVFVDSDSFLDPFAIRNLVQPFKDPKMGGCVGRTDVANTYTNALTKLQAVRYYIAFRIMKSAEGYFDAVTCLSGPLACYRKQIVLDNKDAWLNQKFLGQKATFGDDRSMTNFVLRHHRTTYQDSAICSTIVPNKHKVFLKQQMRWKRSWLRESLIAAKFMWKKEPFAAISFYIGLIVPVAAPIVVLYNLGHVPVVSRIVPVTFLTGLFLMSFLMSAAQLFLRKSSTWLYGFIFCLYYELILLWQMPIAWVTFWKSTWGTRMTPSDILELNKKKANKLNGKEKIESEQEKYQKEVIESSVDNGNEVENLKREGFSVITANGSFYFENDSMLSPDTGMQIQDINASRQDWAKQERKIEEAEAEARKELADSVGAIMAKQNMMNQEQEKKEEKINNTIFVGNMQNSISDIISQKTAEAISEISVMIAEEIKNSIMEQLETQLKEQIVSCVLNEFRSNGITTGREQGNMHRSYHIKGDESTQKEGA